VPQSLAGRAARVTGETPLAPSVPIDGALFGQRICANLLTVLNGQRLVKPALGKSS